jgi:hypothetical protein
MKVAELLAITAAMTQKGGNLPLVNSDSQWMSY